MCTNRYTFVLGVGLQQITCSALRYGTSFYNLAFVACVIVAEFNAAQYAFSTYPQGM